MIHSNGRYFEDYLCICTWMLFLLLKVLVNLSRGLCFFADSMSLKWLRATVFGLRIVSETRDCYYVCLCWFCHFVPNKMYSVLFGCPTFGCLWELESHCREARFSERFRWIHLPPRWNETSVRVSANSSVHFKFLRTTMILMMDRYGHPQKKTWYLI